MQLSTELNTQSHLRPLRVIPKVAVAAATCLFATVVLVVLPVTGIHPANVAAAVTLPTSQSVVVGGDISCGPLDSNFSGSNSSTCQQRATASLIHSLAPNYLIAGGDTQYTPNEAEGQQPTANDYTQGYDASWGGLQTSGNANFVSGLVVRPTPGDHEYGDALENDRGSSLSNASNYYANFGPSGLNDLPAGVTGPASDFYGFDIPLAGGTWHVITLDSECAALPATLGGAPSQGAGGCASGSPEETFLHNDLVAHQGDCILIHFHEPEFSDNFATDTDYQAFWNDAVQFHATAILNNHAHDYERFVPMNASGTSSSTGVTEFVVGTGGNSHVSGSKITNEAFQDTTNFGVLQMTLNATSANYAFNKVGGGTEDSGTLSCQQPTGSGVPTVTSVSPSSGSTAGGTSVTITGTNLSAVNAVRFGSTAASFTLNSATSMTVTSPAGTAGMVDISVTNATGTSATSPNDKFTYSSPAGVITAVGSLVSAHGTALTTLAVSPKNTGDVMVVGIMGQTLSVSSISGGGVTTWKKGAQFQGTVGNDVEIWYGTVTSTGASTISFTWSGTPSSGLEYNAQEFTAGLGATTVWAADKTGTLNGASSTSVPFPSLTPTGTGELYVGFSVVANSATAGSTAGFTYTTTSDANIYAYNPNVSGTVAPTAAQSPAGTSSSVGLILSAPPPVPTVTGVSPSSGSTAGGTSVTITGTGFSGVTGVKFGTVAGTSVVVNSTTSLTVTSPAEAAGAVDVTVTAAGGTSAANPPNDQFTFTAPPVPTVTGVSPSSGSTAGGTSVTITGTGFSGVTGVKFGTVAGTSVVVNSTTSLTVTSPAEAAGAVDVTVTAAGGTSAANPPNDQFTFTAPPVPTVTGVSPSSGSTAGGTSVTITGTGFSGVTGVKFGTVAGTSVVVNSTTSLTVTSPAEAAGAVDVTVTAAGGTSAANPPNDQFTFTAPPVPTVTGVSPSSGPTAGGTSVTITGTGFSGVTGVKFGTVAGTSVVVNSTTSLTVTSPAEAAGAVDVTVTAAGGTSAANPPNDQFTFTAPPVPTVTGVSPSSGSTAGGTSVTITGTGFSGVTGVKFGTVAGTSVVVNSTTSLTVTSPAEAAGAVDVTVTAAGGTSAANPPNDQFTFTAPPVPTVTGVSPSSGSTAGGTSVTITGTGFSGVTGVKFGTVAGTSVVVNSTTSLTVTSPAEAAGAVDVTVTAAGGTSAANPPNDQFTFTAPVQNITAVGSLVSAHGTALTTLAVSPKNTGDVMVVGIMGQTLSVSSISGGGVTTWKKGAQFQGTVGNDVEIWYGTVTSTGASTISFTWSGTPSRGLEYNAQEFTAGLGATTVWAADKTGTLNGASSTSVPFPSLTPTGTGELYVGFSVVAKNATAGSTTGFTYATTSDGNAYAYNLNVSGTVAPTAAQSPAGTSSSVGLILSASNGAPPPVPTVTGVSPSSGSTAGGTSVTITGTGFSGVTGVKFGTVAGTSVVVNSTTSLTVTSPAEAAGAVDVTVTAAGGTSAANPPNDQFTFTAPPVPTVTGVSPSSGSTAGGTSVTITGTGFSGVTGVKFGTVAGTSVVVNSTTSLTVTSPAEAAGAVDVTVTAAGGTSAANPPNDQFTFTAPPVPTVTGVSPSSGSTAGGTSVTITGTGFSGVTGVKFGTVAGTSVVVNSTTSLTVTSPAEAAGAVDVTVTAAGGTSAANPPNDQFTFTAPPVPTVTGVSPSSGSTAGGTSVTITGTGFSGVTGVKFGTVAGTSVVVNSTTSLTVTSPAEAAGAVDVTVTAAGGTSAANPPNDQFTFTAPPVPTVTGVSPSSGSTAGGTSVTITGTGFSGVTGVKFGTVAGTSVVVNSTTSLTVTSPAEAAGAVDVTVTAAGGTSAANPPNDQFTFTAPPVPTVTGVSLSSGSTAGGTSVTITGTGFSGVTGVKFGTVAGTSVVVNSTTSLTVTSPAEAAGAVDVTVTAAGGTSAANPPNDQFTFTAPVQNITAVGSLVSAHGTALTTLAVSPKNTGDVMVVGIMGQTLSVSSISGGGVTTWKKGAQFQGTVGNDVEIWYGTVTSTGASTISFTWSGTPSGGLEYNAQEFTAGLGATTVWAADKTGTLNGASSTSVPFPSLTPTGTGELYVGFSVVANSAAAGSTTGFTYTTTSDANIFTYNPNVSGTVAPTATQSPAGTSSSVGLILSAS